MKKRWMALGAVVVGVVLCAGVAGPELTRMPFPQGARVDGGDLVGVDAGGSFSWVLPTRTGVVLVDAGWDPSGAAIAAEVGDRPVHAIFLTHGHFDHIGALARYPDAVVYAGPGEGPLLRSETLPGGPGAAMATRMMGGAAYVPAKLVEFEDGQLIEVDGTQIRAFHVFGHTVGSAAYVWKDVLFTGDTVVGRGDRVSQIPSPTYTEPDAVRKNLAKVLTVPFERVADGHVGLHEAARGQVEAFVR